MSVNRTPVFVCVLLCVHRLSLTNATASRVQWLLPPLYLVSAVCPNEKYGGGEFC